MISFGTLRCQPALKSLHCINTLLLWLTKVNSPWVRSVSQEDPLGEGIATPVLLPEEPHRQRNLVDYSPWGCRELEGLNRLSTHIPVLGVNRIVGSVPAAAAAKSLQSCPTLCDPIDGSPPGSPVPGILQARTLEWVAISFSNAWKWKWSCSVMSDCYRPHGLQPTRLLCPWDFPGKSTGVGCHCLLQGVYLLSPKSTYKG